MSQIRPQYASKCRPDHLKASKTLTEQKVDFTIFSEGQIYKKNSEVQM